MILAPTSSSQSKGILRTASESQMSMKKISWAEDVKDNNPKVKLKQLTKKAKAIIVAAEKSDKNMELRNDSENNLSSEQLLTATGSLTVQKRNNMDSNLEESSP